MACRIPPAVPSSISTSSPTSIFENATLVAVHAPLEGRDKTRVDPAHRQPSTRSRRRPSDGEPLVIRRTGDQVARRSLDFYQAVGRGVLAKAEREGSLREKIRFLCRFALLIVDEIGYLPVTPGGGNLFFQLVNARYEKGAMILSSNRGFAEWGEVFGDPVVATALLDRLLHHAMVIQIEGSSYRLRQHADL
jgi:hypothetical protein